MDRFGPDGISKMIKLISNKSSKFQTGYIYDYAFVMLTGLSALITFNNKMMNFPIPPYTFLANFNRNFFLLLLIGQTQIYPQIYISLLLNCKFTIKFLWYSFNNLDPNFHQEEKNWVIGFIKFKLGIDGVSILIHNFNSFNHPICILSCINSVKSKVKRVSNFNLFLRLLC